MSSPRNLAGGPAVAEPATFTAADAGRILRAWTRANEPHPDYDRVLVLQDGAVAEDDAPARLLDEAAYPVGTVFKAMWEAHQQGNL